MLIHFLCQHGSILHGMPQQKCAAKACTEGGLGLCDTLLCASNLHVRTSRQSAMALAVAGSAEAWFAMHITTSCGHPILPCA